MQGKLYHTHHILEGQTQHRHTGSTSQLCKFNPPPPPACRTENYTVFPHSSHSLGSPWVLDQQQPPLLDLGLHTFPLLRARLYLQFVVNKRGWMLGGFGAWLHETLPDSWHLFESEAPFTHALLPWNCPDITLSSWLCKRKFPNHLACT